MRIRFLLAAALLAVSPAWAFHKCKGPNGGVVYQATACPEAGEVVGAEIARREAEGQRIKAENERRAVAREETARIRAQMELDTQRQRLQLCKGQIYDDPFVGMTENALKNCTDFWERHGPIARINETETARSVSRQYVFRTGSIKYLYTTNGVVTGIQR